MATESTSESHSTEADSGTGSRRTTSNKETDAGFNRLNQDIGADEAHQGSIYNDTRAWNANTKRDFDVFGEEIHAANKANQAYLEDLRTVRIQMFTNMAANSHALEKQHTAHRDIATDRTWTQINELEAALAAKSGVQADSIQALVAKAVADAINAKSG